MTRMAADEPMRQRMGTAAAERSTTFTWPVATGQYQEVYAEAIARYEASQPTTQGAQ